MFSKIEVNGDGACALFTLLKSAKPKDDGASDIAWNFTKFLVGRDGEVLRRYEPMTTPEQIGEDLAALL
jgi:glutathione peroxidase